MKNPSFNAETNLYCLIGNPVSHSLSSLMHNHAFQKLGLNAVYLAFKVEGNKLGEAIKGLRALNIKGANITIPYKTSVIEHLDIVDDTAKRIGAVNTVKNINGKLVGYNTDWEAAVELLKEKAGKLQGKNALIIGAGGVARAILYGLLKNSVNVSITNRTMDKARLLTFELKKHVGEKAECTVLNPSEIREKISDFQIIINATPLGMTPNINKTPLNTEYLTSEIIVFDTVYNPLETLLIKKAKQKGCIIIEGYRMLVKQGALSFKLWTGIPPPETDMEKIVYMKLKGDLNE